MIKKKAWEYIINLMAIHMKVNGIMTNQMEKENSISKMVINMKEMFYNINQMVMEFINILIKLIILVFGKIIKEKDKELINVRIKNMKVNG